jgi:precorrin-3B synthase
MIERSDLVKGWCPGALRPMESGDGLIVRVRPRLSALSRSQLMTLAEVAGRFGDGNLYLTSRANIQIRGIDAAGFEGALEALARADLLDGDPRIEAIRNMMVTPEIALYRSPMTPEALSDKISDPMESGIGAYPASASAKAARLASALEEALASNEELLALPGKFGIAVQADREFDLAYVSDVTFSVHTDRILMVLDGARDQAVFFGEMKEAVDGFIRVSRAFLQLRERASITRMTDAVSKFGLDAVLKAAGLSYFAHGLVVSSSRIAVGDLGQAFGIGFPFGEITQPALGRTLEFMQREGVTQVAVSRHRVMVFPYTEGCKPDYPGLARRIGGISDPGDVRLRIHACPGAPACSRGTVAARQDAEAILHVLSDMSVDKAVIHISGCEKRCAYAQDADITAVGVNGRYEVTRSGSRSREAVDASGLPGLVADFARAP